MNKELIKKQTKILKEFINQHDVSVTISICYLAITKMNGYKKELIRQASSYMNNLKGEEISIIFDFQKNIMKIRNCFGCFKFLYV